MSYFIDVITSCCWMNFRCLWGRGKIMASSHRLLLWSDVVGAYDRQTTLHVQQQTALSCYACDAA